VRPQCSCACSSIASGGWQRTVPAWHASAGRELPPSARVEVDGMASKWVRVLAAFIVGAATLVIGLAAAGNLDTTANPDTGLVAGSNSFMLVLALALLLGFIAYAVVEYAQTRRLDSIARQFDTRTIVLMPIAIAINIVLGQTVGTALKIPLYLDSVGTILVGALAGPIPGALTGLLANLIW